MLVVINISQLVTLRGPRRPRIGAEMRNLSVIEDGVLVVREGRIAEAGTRDKVRIPDDAEVIDAGGRIVLPGFVDAHTHPVFAGNRADEFEMRAEGKTYRQIAAAGGGINSTVERTRRAAEEELMQAGRRYASWFLRTGTTTIEAKSGYGLSLDDEIRLLRVIRRLNDETDLDFAPTFLGAHTVPPEFKGRSDDYVKLVIRGMIPQVASEGLAEFCDVFCEEGAFSVDQSRRILLAAREAGMKLRLHADQLTKGEGALLAAELRAFTADHLEHTDRRGIETLKSAGVQPVLLPAAVLMLGSERYPDARGMVDAGLPVVIATDFNPGSSPVPSMPLVLSLASTRMKMTPAESITAATINAAYSIGRGYSIGSLEPGKIADFVIHDCEDYRELPYFTGIEHASSVFKAGRLVYQRS
ncbi:MAG: imidazolonepropionase [Acidobacteriota bacterium]|nr:MAG: imidazolonepropionase [Acidobacteriota bacterium]